MQIGRRFCGTRHKGGYDDRLRIMKKLFAALTVLGIVLGTATLATTPANAAFPRCGYQGDNQGATAAKTDPRLPRNRG